MRGPRFLRKARFFAPRVACACALVLVPLLGACDADPKPAAGTGAPTGSTTAAPAPSAKPGSARPTPTETVAEGVDLLKMELTSEVKNKEPVDKLDSAKPGERVYAHLTVRNRTAGQQRVSLSFRINDEERTMVDLKVEKSWSWRTWAYVTLRKDDKGELTVHAFDDHGAELATKSIPIK